MKAGFPSPYLAIEQPRSRLDGLETFHVNTVTTVGSPQRNRRGLDIKSHGREPKYSDVIGSFKSHKCQATHIHQA